MRPEENPAPKARPRVSTGFIGMILAGFEVVSYIDAHARIDLFNTTEFTENTESMARIAFAERFCSWSVWNLN